MGQFYNAPCLTPIRRNSFSTIRFIGPKIYINFLIWHFNNFNQNLLKFLFQSKPNRGCCSLMFFLNYIEVRPSTLYIPVSFLEYLRSDYVTKMNGRVWLLLESIELDSVVVSLVSSFDSWVGPLLAQLQCLVLFCVRMTPPYIQMLTRTVWPTSWWSAFSKLSSISSSSRPVVSFPPLVSTLMVR